MTLIRLSVFLALIAGLGVGFIISQIYFPTVEEVIKEIRSSSIQEICRNPVIITETTTPDIYYETVFVPDNRTQVELHTCIKDTERLYARVQALENEIMAWELSFNDLKNKCEKP